MSSENLLNPLAQLLEQAEALQVLAQAEDWLGLEAEMASYLEKVGLIEDKAYLQALKDAGLALSAQGFILQIHGINKKIDDLAQDSQQKIASELRHIIQSGKAMDAYGR